MGRCRLPPDATDILKPLLDTKVIHSLTHSLTLGHKGDSLTHSLTHSLLDTKVIIGVAVPVSGIRAIHSFNTHRQHTKHTQNTHTVTGFARARHWMARTRRAP